MKRDSAYLRIELLLSNWVSSAPQIMCFDKLLGDKFLNCKWKWLWLICFLGKDTKEKNCDERNLMWERCYLRNEEIVIFKTTPFHYLIYLPSPNPMFTIQCILVTVWDRQPLVQTMQWRLNQLLLMRLTLSSNWREMWPQAKLSSSVSRWLTLHRTAMIDAQFKSK